MELCFAARWLVDIQTPCDQMERRSSLTTHASSYSSNMANPRKFAEKIALHTQKQEEETRAFEQIMKEVSMLEVFVIFLIGKNFFGLVCWSLLTCQSTAECRFLLCMQDDQKAPTSANTVTLPRWITAECELQPTRTEPRPWFTGHLLFCTFWLWFSAVGLCTFRCILFWRFESNRVILLSIYRMH